MGDHGNLLLTAALHRALRRYDLNASHRGIAALAIRHALRDPTAHQTIFVRVFIEALSAAMRHGVGGFEQQQALFRRSGKQPPAAALFDEVLEIFIGLETEK
jgi:hypothetical protein